MTTTQSLNEITARKNYLAGLLEMACQELELPEGQREIAERAYNSVGTWLSDCPTLGQFRPAIFPRRQRQGLWRIGDRRDASGLRQHCAGQGTFETGSRGRLAGQSAAGGGDCADHARCPGIVCPRGDCRSESGKRTRDEAVGPDRGLSPRQFRLSC